MIDLEGADRRNLFLPRWRLSNLYSIINKQGDAQPFRPNEAQLEFLDNIHNLNIILKSRQLGFTTLCCLIYLDACLFNPNTRVGVIAHKLDDAKTIFRDRIKWPYDTLPEMIKERVSAVQDSADTLTFSNNSSIRVSTSMRSATLQYLHVSEYGKISAQMPEKAREIRTGALNTVAPGQHITIESTAEGQEGAFHELCQRAMTDGDMGRPLTELDFKFHFFPWWQEPAYALPGAQVPIGEEYLVYFDKLFGMGIRLSEAQQAWYVKQDILMGSDMRREYPSFPEEAFESALEGAFFSGELAIAGKQQRIAGFPLDSRFPVNTFWDLGRNDLNTIWLHQFIGGYHRFVGYYENSGEFIGHYIKWLRDWADERTAIFGSHYLPHDGDRQSLWLEGGTIQVMDNLKFHPEVISRPVHKSEAIQAARTIFSRCQFDEVGCSVGLKRLRSYRKDWDEARGIWRDRPRHDDASHGADAFLTFACADLPGTEALVVTRKRYQGQPARARAHSFMSG